MAGHAAGRPARCSGAEDAAAVSVVDGEPVTLRDRIVDFRRVPSEELADNPRNWRKHPEGQKAALDDVLASIGIAGAVLAYYSERNGGRLTLIDGHERRTRYADWPTLITDLDDAEADLLLATHDPMAMLAGVDPEKLRALLDDVSISNEAMLALLGSLAGDEHAGDVDLDKEWVGMPEMSQEDQLGLHLVVRFRTAEDMARFAKLVKQSLTGKTRAIWFPKADVETIFDKRYASGP